MIPLSRVLIDDIKPFFFFSNYGLTLFLIPGNTFENFADEVGLLRELTYRQKLSGSGNNKDLDGRDPYYDHFVLVDDTTFALAGTARLQFVPNLRPAQEAASTPSTHSSSTSYLEHVYPGIKNCLMARGSHLEIGRVAISPAFQRQPASLMTLFRGGLQAAIAAGYTAVYGLVSYNHFQYPGSVNDFFLRSLMLPPFRSPVADLPPARYPRAFRGDEQHADGTCQTIQQLEAEAQKQLPSFRLPVLLRQYINLMGARTHDTSIAKDFNQITEILMTADLTKVPHRRLQHFVGFPHAPVYQKFPWFRGDKLTDQALTAQSRPR